MGSRLKLSVICSSCLISILLVVGAVLGKSEQQEGAYRPLAVYTEILARIKSDYVEEPDIAKVTQGALHGLVEYLDSASSYLSKEQFDAYQEALRNSDGGSGLASGMVVRKQGAYTSVLSVVPGSPADEAGIRADDLLDAIDDVSTRVMPPAYLQAMLSGAAGTGVKVMVRPASDYESPVEHTLVRTDPSLPEIASRMLKDGIGYVDVDFLGDSQVDQVSSAIQRLEADGAEKLIVDLRGNAMGSPDAGMALADLLLDGGTIAKLEGQNYTAKVFNASAGSAVTELPVVMIVDRPTSGGAEIAAAAIQQNDRGEVVGEETSGLAAVQETISLDDGAALILSVANYHGPGGEVIHNEGVEPDRAVSQRDLRRYREVRHRLFDTPEARQRAEEEVGDPFLKQALEALAGKA
ncbi:MAG: S41 family peptidase [Bryobacterales bacterium]|nr:S41 family peptidase [Bryobacterales bacterium]MDE0264391.1 S41 family peptidase [Bryobacterales bacterium]